METLLGARFTPLLDLPYFDAVRFIVIDQMHNLWLGTAEKFFRTLVKEEYFTEDDLEITEEKFEAFDVPSDLGRLPGKISSNWTSFKADEWKNWTSIFSMYCF